MTRCWDYATRLVSLLIMLHTKWPTEFVCVLCQILCSVKIVNEITFENCVDFTKMPHMLIYGVKEPVGH